eukprot:scaffold45372_cov69-Phaeocystis_antarctica.AAC.2
MDRSNHNASITQRRTLTGPTKTKQRTDTYRRHTTDYSQPAHLKASQPSQTSEGIPPWQGGLPARLACSHRHRVGRGVHDSHQDATSVLELFEGRALLAL